MDGIKYIEDSAVEKFIKSANQLHQMDNSINIDYAKYIAKYNHASKRILPIIAKLNLKKFQFLSESLPNFNFDFEGRLKSEYSFFDKIIRQAIEKGINPDNISTNKDDEPYYALYDIFAFRVILNSVSYNVDRAICTYNERKKAYQYQFANSNAKKLQNIKSGDVITFSDGNSITVTPNNLTLMNNVVYVISENGSYLPINGSKITKTDRSTLDKALYQIKDTLSSFYEANGYKHIENRDKDYVKNPKTLRHFVRDSQNRLITDLKNRMTSENTLDLIARLKRYNIKNRESMHLSNGKFIPCYQSLHQTYYYEPYDIYFEDQIRTIHMHNIAEYSEHFGHDVYKSNRLDENSLSKLPSFITYSKEIIDGKPQYLYQIHDMEYSVEKSFGISLEEFIEAMNKLNSKNNPDTKNTPDNNSHETPGSEEGPEI